MCATPGRAVVDHRITPVGVELRVGLAAQRRRGVADAPGIESHQIETAADLGAGQLGSHRGSGVDRRGSRSTGIDQQRSDPRTGRRNSDHRELSLAATGVVVVDGDRNGGALRAGNVVRMSEEPAASAPGQLRRRRRRRARRWAGIRFRRRACYRRGATAATIGNTNESSAENNRLMRHMAANRPTRRPRAVIPMVTPWSRYLLRGPVESRRCGASTLLPWTAQCH